MSFLDPNAEAAAVQQAVFDQITAFFPFTGKKNTLSLRRIYTGQGGGIDDIRGQKTAKLRGKTWSVPVYADLELRTSEGKVLDAAKKVKLLNLPKITRRLSYIVNGGEVQVLHQWRLKSGAYSRIKDNGELETQFMLKKGRNFAVGFDPKSRKYTLSYGTSNIALLPILRALGAPEAELEAAWGLPILEANKGGNAARELSKLYKAMHGSVPASNEQAIQGIREAFAETQIGLDTTEVTLGKSLSKVDKEALVLASGRLLGISRGDAPPDSRDSLQFKELWALEDYLPQRLTESSRRVTRQINNNLDRKRKVREIVSISIFNDPIAGFFNTALAEQTAQTNPIDMISSQRKATVMGPGGIQSPHAVSRAAKLVDPSHLGFLDPIPTPEGEKTGATTYLSINTTKRGRQAVTKMYNTKTKKLESVTPEMAAESVIAFPDQYVWDEGVPKPIGKRLKVSSKGNELDEVTPSKVDYIMTSSRGMFTLSTNFVPFLQNDQGNRVNYAAKQMSQAISLKDREVPLVQVHTGGKSPSLTWEKVVGAAFSFRSPVSGTVAAIGRDYIKIRDKNKELHEVKLYRNYPLNDGRSFIDSEVKVKRGDEVDKGQVIADTNFTVDGTLAIGVNLRVAYLPFKSLTFEDGIVVSDTAAKKLTSEHMYQERSFIGRDYLLNKAKFRSHYPTALTDEQSDKLDSDGVIKEGAIVQPGDTLVASLRKTDMGREQLLLGGIHRSLMKPYRDSSLRWEKDIPGVVDEVVRVGREIKVHVRTEEPAQAGDKLAGRHGNKGVISRVLPDEEMPHDKDGNPIEIIMNPSGVPGRINPGQILETVLGKVANEKGEPYAVTNFEVDPLKRIVKVKGHWRTLQAEEGEKKIWIKAYERTYYDVVKDELEASGLTDREPLYDPETGEELSTPGDGKGILTGHHYVLKLEHTSEKKMTARGQGIGYEYTSNMGPRGGGKHGAQSMGELGIYAMLAHGNSAANLREMMTIKSDRAQDDFWTALQSGEALPTPKAPFAYEKFGAYLNALGVDIVKKGHELHLIPMTDKEIVAQSNGALKHPSKLVRAKDLRPEKGGLFDEVITGGLRGSGWSHIPLSEPVPNPIFEKALISLTGLSGKEYNSLVSGASGLDKEGNVVPAAEATHQVGGAVKYLLDKLNVKKELLALEESIKTMSGAKLDAANKKIKYLRALDQLGMSPSEAYLLNNIPVLPPQFRPLTILETGDLNVDDLNGMYQQIAINLEQLRSMPVGLPSEYKNPLRAELYDAMKSLAGLGGRLNLENKGILDIIAGPTPKAGFFTAQLLKRKQDLTMRAVITPADNLDLDEVGIPRKAAMELFKPFIIRDLVRLGYTPNQAREQIDTKTEVAKRSLENVVSKRPVLMKRDPALHKFSVMAFMPKLVEGHTLQIHPLVTGGYGADFDGDQHSLYVPVTNEAVKEAYEMLPSRNLFAIGRDLVMYQPALESQLGLFNVTRWGRSKGKKFKTADEALVAAKGKELPYDEVITVGAMKTTAGRLLVDGVLPKDMQGGKLLTDSKFSLGNTNLQVLMKEMATDHPNEFPTAINKIKDIGYNHSYKGGWTIPLDDLAPLRKVRDEAFATADKKIAAAIAKGASGDKLDSIRIDAFSKAIEDMDKGAKQALSGKGNNLFRMTQAGVKPTWGQLRQLLLAPVLMEDGKGGIIPVPIRRSYTEGLDVSEYWIASHAARQKALEKVQEVQKPGALNKQISNTVMNLTVTQDDCGTNKGIHLDSSSRDALDRFTATSIKVRGGVLAAGTLVTPKVMNALRSSKIRKVHVRSPLRCKVKKGICAKCFGAFNGGKIPSLRTNIGMMAGTAVGERSVNLTLKSFHSGGTAKKGVRALPAFDRLKQVLEVPEILKGSATLSTVDGQVKAVSKDPAGGWRVTVGQDTHYVPQDRNLLAKKGDRITKGQPLSGGPINPKELLDLTNVATVQNYLTGEMEKIYTGMGLKRRNFEVIVKAMTNLSSVVSSGDHPEFIRGDIVSTSDVAAWNRTNPKRDQVKLQPILKGLNTYPLEASQDWAARMNFRRLKDTLVQAASKGWKADIHGTHPVPGLMFGAEFGKPPVDKPWAY